MCAAPAAGTCSAPPSGPPPTRGRIYADIVHESGFAPTLVDSVTLPPPAQLADAEDGAPSVLQPYMGMRSHAAVFRNDGSVFVHLHPAGSINMTAQQRFARAAGAEAPAMGMSSPTDRVTFPFVFPEPGAWRIVVQVRVGGVVETGAFDLDVDGPDGGAE